MLEKIIGQIVGYLLVLSFLCVLIAFAFGGLKLAWIVMNWVF